MSLARYTVMHTSDLSTMVFCDTCPGERTASLMLFSMHRGDMVSLDRLLEVARAHEKQIHPKEAS